jgi:hypothetical protein
MRAGRTTSSAITTLAFVAVAGASACARDQTQRPDPTARAQKATLESGVVARVGSAPIPASLVAAVARSTGVPPKDALDALIEDALFAEGARAQSFASRRSIREELSAMRARLVAERIRADALAAGPPSDAEVAEITADHWQDVDHGDEVAVIHAAALRDKKPNAQKDNAAKSVIAQVAKAVLAAKTADEFEKLAMAVPHEGVDLVVERLPPVAVDGRLGTQGGQLDAEFARGAFTVANGGTSGVVESGFGWHVIRQMAKVPAVHMPLEERRALFAVEARERRAQKAMDEILQRQRGAVKLESASAVDAILREAKLP